MLNPQPRIGEHTVTFVYFVKFDVAVRAADIWVRSARELMIFFLHHVSIQPRQTRLLEEKEEVSHAAKLSPQEQCATAFGLVTLNPPFCRSSLKSSNEPLTKSALLGSTTTRTFCD